MNHYSMVQNGEGMKEDGLLHNLFCRQGDRTNSEHSIEFSMPIKNQTKT